MGEDFRLKWNDHHSVFFSTAESLCHGDHLTDVTLSCGSREFSAHKLVLSICSSYFSQLFAPKPGAKKRPADSAAIVYLKDVDGRHMELLLNYMYRGEINVEESELMGLLATAKGLQIKGLTENDDTETPKEEPRGTPVRSVSRGGASTSNSGVKRPQPSSKSTHIPAPKKIKEESSHLNLAEAANASAAASNAVEVEESDYQNAEYLDDTEDIADYSMEDNPGESMVYEGDPNNPGELQVSASTDDDHSQHRIAALEISEAPVLPSHPQSQSMLSEDVRINDQVVIQKDPIHSCFACTKVFTHKWMLERHMLTHTGEQPFACSICLRKFSLQASCLRDRKSVV